MKKTIFLLVTLMIACSGEASAQKWLKNVGKALEKVDKFLDTSTTSSSSTKSPAKSSDSGKTKVNQTDYTKKEVLAVDFNNVGEPVDLGLSVKWSSRNFGAAEPFQYGAYTTLQEDNLSKYWGDEWRLPTEAEWNELLTKCQIKAVEVRLKQTGTQIDEVGYLLVIGPNGNKIWLPMAGLDEGDHNWHERSGGFYWISDFYTKPVASVSKGPFTMVEYIAPDYESGGLEKFYGDVNIYYGASLRPVYVGPEGAKAKAAERAAKGFPEKCQWQTTTSEEKNIIIDLNTADKEFMLFDIKTHGFIIVKDLQYGGKQVNTIDDVKVNGNSAKLKFTNYIDYNTYGGTLTFNPTDGSVTLSGLEMLEKSEFNKFLMNIPDEPIKFTRASSPLEYSTEIYE